MSSSATATDSLQSLTYQQAIDIARTTEGDLDPKVADFLEQAIADIWSNIETFSDSYVMTKAEFAVLCVGAISSAYRLRLMTLRTVIIIATDSQAKLPRTLLTATGEVSPKKASDWR